MFRWLLLIGIIGYMLNIELLFCNEELLIALSLSLFFFIFNYFMRKILVLILFNRNISIYISFKNIFFLNIVLIRAVSSICQMMVIFSSHWFNYFNFLVRIGFDLLTINYKVYVNIILSILKVYLNFIKIITLKYLSISKVIGKKLSLLGILLSVFNKNLDNKYFYCKSRVVDLFLC